VKTVDKHLQSAGRHRASQWSAVAYRCVDFCRVTLDLRSQLSLLDRALDACAGSCGSDRLRGPKHFLGGVVKLSCVEVQRYLGWVHQMTCTDVERTGHDLDSRNCGPA
jgi:hypothetical protein